MDSAFLSIPSLRYGYITSVWDKILVLVNDERKILANINYTEGIVMLSTQANTPDPSDLKRCARFIQAIIMGFNVQSAVKLLHRDNVITDCLTVDQVNGALGGGVLFESEFDFLSLFGNFSKNKVKIEQLSNTMVFVDRSSVYLLGTPSSILDAKHLIISHLSRLLIRV